MCCQQYTVLKRKGRELQNDCKRTSWLAFVLLTVLQTACTQEVNSQNEVDTLSSETANLLPPLKRLKPPTLPCNSERTLKAGDEYFIQTPEFRRMKYPNSASCEWRLKSDSCNMGINCPDFKLTDFLCFDHMDIVDKNGTMSRYCGENGPKDAFLSEEVAIAFRSSAWFPNIGFRCRIVCRESEAQSPFPKEEEKPSPCHCGIANKRIVGGEQTEISHFPWQAGLVRKGGSQPFCGGSLINSKYVLTAAHCVKGRTPYNLEIIFNVTDFRETGGELMEIRRTVDNILVHRNFTSRLDFDAALIRLGEPVDITGTAGKTILPVCLPSEKEVNNTYADEIATVLGWGLTAEDGDPSPFLQKADVQVISNEECSTFYPTVTDRMLCAHTPGRDACQGDSGGPLLYEEGKKQGEDVSPWGNSHNRFIQIGIVSWGHGCASRPGVYSRVTEMIRWIASNAKDGSYCEH